MWKKWRQLKLDFFGKVDLIKSTALLTMSVDVVGEEEVELSDRHVDVVRVDAQSGMEAVRRLFQPLPVGAFQWNCLEQDYLDQI